MPDPIFARSLEARLRKNPLVADCTVLTRSSEQGDRLLAFVVPSRTPDQEHWLEAEQHALETGMPSEVLLVDRLPLRADGAVDEVSLLALPSHDAASIAELEAMLARLPGVRHAVVLPMPRNDDDARLHMDALLPVMTQPVVDVSFAEQESKLEQPARPLAIAHGAARTPAAGEPSTLPQSLASSISRGGARILYIEDDGGELSQSLSGLRDEAQCVLAGLRNAGLTAGQFVILQLARPRDVLPAFWGCLFGGVVPVVVPVPASFKGESSELDKLRAVWRLLGEPAIVSTSEACAALGARGECTNVLPLQELRAFAADRDQHHGHADDVAFLSLSSGSTGTPKCIQLTHRNILSRGRASSVLCDQNETDVVLNWLPFDHIGSISDWHLRCVDLGCSMVYCSKERVLGDPLNWLRMIEQQRVTHSWAPNFAYALINSALARAGDERWDLSRMKFLLTAGEAVSSRTLEELLSSLKSHGLPATAARSAFGMAELGSGITYSQPSASLPVKVLNVDRASLRAGLREVPLGDARSIPFSGLGPVIAGMSMRIVDADDQTLPERRIGRLQVRGEALSPGYYQNDEANQAFHADGWFETGDEGFLDAGELYLTGRGKDCLIISGANYFPIEIEKVVEELPSVSVSFTAAYTVRAPGQQREQAALFFVPSGQRDLVTTLREVAQRVAQRVGVKLDFLVPLLASDVPKTAIGKIQRKQLAARFEAGDFTEQQRKADLLLANERTIPSWFAEQAFHRVALRSCFRCEEGRRFVILADQRGLAQRVRDQLPADSCVLVEHGAPFEQTGERSFRADRDDASQLAALLQQLAGNAPLHVLDLRPLDVPAVDFGAAQAAQLQDTSDRVHALLQGVSSLAALGLVARLTVVGSAAHQVQAEEPLCAVGTLLPALLEGAKLANVDLRTSYIDLPAPPDAQLAHAPQLALELTHDSADSEVCFRAGLRHARRLSPVECGTPRQALEQAGLYVITGGLGGLAGELARLLLTRFGARLLMLGKSEPDQQRGAQLAALRALGEAHYEAIDVRDAHAVRAAVVRAERRAGRAAAGFFHLAGAYGAAHNVEQQSASAWQVMEAKLLGALSLHALLLERPEALMVHYGSAASGFPDPRGAAYAAANRFLEGISQQQRRLGFASYTLGFSAWSGAGMNARGVSEPLLRERGLHLISPAEGLGSLLAVLADRPRNVLVGVRSDSPSMRRLLNTPARPLAELRGFYLQDGEAACLPAQLDVGPITLSIEQLASAPTTLDGTIDRALLLAQLRGPVAMHVAPSNALEEHLLEIWKNVLKTQSLGVTDDFFMRGGHSLLAAELVHVVNQRFATTLPLSLVFEAKTIRAQAQLIDAGKHGQGVSIVPLQPKGNEPPLFCICGINIYQELANELAPNIPVYGVLLPIEGELLEGRDVKLSVPEMAREYARAIREKQPEGPYRVLGLSFGAALAYEAAQQLRAQGAEVSLLTMLDFVHPAGRTRSLRQYAQGALTRLKREKSGLVARARKLLQRDQPNTALPERATVRMSAYQEAWQEYEPALLPYNGKVLVIRAEDQSMWDGFEVARDLGWRRFVAKLEQRDVPGDHLSILRAPNVQVLAEHLRDLLESKLAAQLITDDVCSLRGKLDQLDRSLLDVLKERMTVVAELGSVKREQGLDVRDVEREQQVLDTRLAWAQRERLPDSLVRPMFGLIMSASRQLQERERRALFARPEAKTIAVIGAQGGMGKRMCALFQSLGHRVLEVDLNSDLSAEEAAARADVTMIAVPIAVTEQVVRAVGPHVPAHGLLMDITSIKARPLQAMLESTSASVVGTHPMFGPLVSSLQGQRVVICAARGDAWARWVESTFQAGGLETAGATAEEHDRAMAEVQVLNHFQTQVMGLTLARLGTSLEQSLRFTTPPYLMELYMAARHFSQDSALYGPIAMDNPLTAQITQAFVDATSTVRDILLRRDTEGLAGVFSEVRSFLGAFGPHGVEQSKLLVEALVRGG